jgi:hypothetical protein
MEKLMKMNVSVLLIAAASCLTAFSCATGTAQGPDGFVSRYLEMRSAEDQGSGKDLAWWYTEKVETSASGSITVIKRQRESYEGGAHGSQELVYSVFNKADGDALKLADIVLAGQEGRLAALLMGALREKAELAEGAPLTEGGYFEDTVTAPENFFPDADGLSFVWNTYEIAPYVMGIIDVTVPWSALQGVLNANGKALETAFAKR